VTSTTISSSAPDELERPWPHHLALGAVLFVALLAYSNSFTGAFVFDDLQHVRDNLRIRDLGALFTWQGYLPLRHRFVGYVTFAVNHALGGLQVANYHVVNFAIHAANTALVYALVLLGFRTPRLRESALAPSAQAIAVFAAALFATHPLQTQAVTYVVQRFTSLSTLFYLLTVVLFLRWRLEGEAHAGRARGTLLYAALLVAAVLGMKTKEISFTAPLAVVLCELTFFGPLPWSRRLFLAPILATMLIIPASYLGGALGSGAGASAAGGALGVVGDATRVQSTVSRTDYLLTQAPVVLAYLRLLAWPAGQNLDHDLPVAHRLLEARVLGSALVPVALAALAAILYRRTRPGAARGGVDPGARLVAFGIAWFFLGLAVESSFVPIVDVMNEHRVYLPSVGMFVAVGCASAFLFQRVDARRAARALVIGAAVLSAVLAVATFRRNRVWASELSVWADTAAKSPGKARPHMNLGSALCLAGHVEEGARELRRALELGVDSETDAAYARAQLGAAFVALGRPAEAEPELREAVRLKPTDPEAVFNLALVLTKTGRLEEARPLWSRFLDVAPSSAAYAKARRFAEARVGR
jgi:tetratricopeptide (TPR) repeat protein